jgi:hypothetical protein
MIIRKGESNMAFDNTQVFTLTANQATPIGVYVGDYNIIRTGTAMAYPISKLGTWGEGGGSINPPPGTFLSVGPAVVDVLSIYSQEGTTGADLVAYIVRWVIESDTWGGRCEFAMNWIGEGVVGNHTAPLRLASKERLSHPHYAFDHSKSRIITKSDGSIVAYRLPGEAQGKNPCDILPMKGHLAHDLDVAPEHKEILIGAPQEAFKHLRVVVRNGTAILESPTLPLPPPRA